MPRCQAAPGGPAGWSKCWYDIGTNVPANEMRLLLGGEMSMLSDSYGNFDIISRISQLSTTCHAPCTMLYVAPMPIGAD